MKDTKTRIKPILSVVMPIIRTKYSTKSIERGNYPVAAYKLYSASWCWWTN